MATDNKALARRLYEELWNQQRLETADELLSPDYVSHDPQSPTALKGLEGYKQAVRYYLNAFPDIQFTIEDQICERDTVVTRWTSTATHKGDLAGIPATGRRISNTGIICHRVKDGKFVESWSNWDVLGMMQQLGAAPSQASDKPVLKASQAQK